jgi:hypothetical protein
MRILFALLCASLAFGADLPSGESLLARAVESSGGTSAYAKAQTVLMTGTIEMMGRNLKGPITLCQKGSKAYSVIELPGIGKVEEGFNGEIAWEMSALQGARIQSAEEKGAMQRAARFNLLTSWREYYKSAQTAGETEIDGHPAWKVELTPKEGKVEQFFFDKDSGLLVRIAQTIPSAMGDIPVEVTMSDYRTVEGIKTPFSMVQKAMGQVLAMHFEKVTYNADLPADRFDLPPAVQALADQKKK